MKRKLIKNFIALLICTTVAFLCVLAINATVKREPLAFFFDDFKSFFLRINENLIFYPVGLVLQLFTEMNDGNYFLGIIQLTVFFYSLIRPVLSRLKQNSYRMQLVNREIKQVDDKYASMDIPNKESYVNMHKQQIFKKYKVNPLWNFCLPLINVLAFWVLFTVVIRFPYTAELHNSVNTTFLGLNLFEEIQKNGEYFIVLTVLAAVYFLIEFYRDKLNISTDEMISVISRRKKSTVYKFRKIMLKAGTGFGIVIGVIDLWDSLLWLNIWSDKVINTITVISFIGWIISETINILFPAAEWILLKIKAQKLQRASSKADKASKESEVKPQVSMHLKVSATVYLIGVGLMMTNALGVAVFMLANTLYNVFGHIQEQVDMIHYVQDSLDEDEALEFAENQIN